MECFDQRKNEMKIYLTHYISVLTFIESACGSGCNVPWLCLLRHETLTEIVNSCGCGGTYTIVHEKLCFRVLFLPVKAFRSGINICAFILPEVRLHLPVPKVTALIHNSHLHVQSLSMKSWTILYVTVQCDISGNKITGIELSVIKGGSSHE